jgi:hypothetical protein
MPQGTGAGVVLLLCSVPRTAVMSCNTPCTALIVCLQGDRLLILGASGLPPKGESVSSGTLNAERSRHGTDCMQRPECSQCGYGDVLQVYARTATYECSVPHFNQSRSLCCLCTASRHIELRPAVLQHESYIGLRCVDSISDAFIANRAFCDGLQLGGVMIATNSGPSPACGNCMHSDASK